MQSLFVLRDSVACFFSAYNYRCEKIRYLQKTMGVEYPIDECVDLVKRQIAEFENLEINAEAGTGTLLIYLNFSYACKLHSKDTLNLDLKDVASCTNFYFPESRLSKRTRSSRNTEKQCNTC